MDNIQPIKEYVTKNLISSASGEECVDGRNEPKGRIARPGAHLGYVMVLLTLNKQLNLGLTPIQCFDLIYDFIASNNGFFDMHTDTHADPTERSHEEHHHGPIIGCGHASKPTNPELSQSYALDSQEMVEVINYTRQRIKNGDKIRFDVLKGDHKEEGVLVVTSKENTVKHFDENKMFFVYDKLRDDEMIENLVKEINLPGVTLEKFKEISDQQTNATLHILAKDLPIYDVTIVDSEPKVEFIGTVA